MNYYERHIGDYAKDAGHLSMLEHGAYTLLLDRYYSTEQPIPVDQVYRIARARTEEECAAVDTVLREFFKPSEKGWVNGRGDEEIEKARLRIEIARENGKKGGRPKKQAEKNPMGIPEETQSVSSGIGSGNQTLTQEKALHLPHPISKSGEDPRTKIFELGKSLLGASSGGLISKAISQTDEATVFSVLGEMAARPTADPRAYFAKATKPKQRGVVV